MILSSRSSGVGSSALLNVRSCSKTVTKPGSTNATRMIRAGPVAGGMLTIVAVAPAVGRRPKPSTLLSSTASRSADIGRGPGERITPGKPGGLTETPSAARAILPGVLVALYVLAILAAIFVVSGVVPRYREVAARA